MLFSIHWLILHTRLAGAIGLLTDEIRKSDLQMSKPSDLKQKYLATKSNIQITNLNFDKIIITNKEI